MTGEKSRRETGQGTVTVTVQGTPLAVPCGTTYEEIAEQVKDRYPAQICVALADGRLRELFHAPEKDQVLDFYTLRDKPGYQTYQRSAVLLAMKAFYDVAGYDTADKVTVEFSVSKGLYIVPHMKEGHEAVSVEKVEKRMRELVSGALPIEKSSVSTDEALERFHEYGMYDKEKIFSYRRVSRMNLYQLEDYQDYYYGYMLPNTKYLKWFALYPYGEGFVLQLPDQENPGEVPAFAPQPKLFAAMQETARWSARLGVNTVGDLNDRIVNGGLEELILVQEALMEKRLGEIAETIASDRRKKIVLIAGPSSSGKTSFSYRLSIQMRAFGLTPHPISVDNYFVDREKTPLDENGEYDFEALECIDIEQFNEDMTRLLAGEEVMMPSFNFVKGAREYRGDTLQLGPDDTLVIEGIHCLNDRLTYRLPSDCRYRIYISALTSLNIDEHNRIPTTDGRLIRRIVRDARTRGTSAQETIARWGSVRRGEEKNIFPFQESGDVTFNSALIYELAILKSYAEPLLFSVPRDSAEYLEAKRLLKFFDYFLPAPSEEIPHNSLLREFIGGSVFPVG